MYLKRIEIAGFKSFADRTAIDFENSVTAVVGPNGSGKSNITEAIRWVLGEQSAKSLRGGKMPDIIFAGSDSRKPLNFAEVTVILDNSDHYLPMDYTEISVTRRLRRTGESDFFINKQSCRLKDIQDLFMDSGLGKESFSIISQGKVEAIFSSKPEDRRGIFEEAAGVLKYKQRKKKAEQKLFETEDNLSRVQDIIYELEEQLAPLAEQSRSAKEFLRLKAALTKVDVAFTVTEIKESKADWEQATEALATVDQELDHLAAVLKTGEEQVQVQRWKRTQLDEWLEEANQQLLHLTEALKQAEGQREVLLERSKHTQKSSQEYQTALAENQERFDQLSESKTTLIHQMSEKNREFQLLEEQTLQMQTEFEKYQKSTKEVIEELRGQYVEKMQEHANVGNELKHLERQYLQETAKNQQAVKKQEQLTATIKEFRQQQQQTQTALQSAKQTLKEQRSRYLQLQEAAKQSQQQFAEEQKKMYQLMSQLQQARGKQKSLQEIQESYAGFYQGVRYVLKHKEQLTGIVGAVAELIEVPTAYTTAIETALGGAAQHIVVEKEADARNGITFLKQQRGGRATFLPMTTIQSRKVSAAVENQAASVAGYLGVASDLVQVSDELQKICENLLGSVLIAEDLASANALARAVHYRYRVVSLEGDVMNAGGSMTGGTNKKGQSSLFTQTNELQLLIEQVASFEQRLQTTEKQVQRFEKKAKENQTQVEVLRTTGETARLKEQELENQVQNVTHELARLEKEQAAFAFENREIQLFLAEYGEQKTDYLQRQKKVEAQREAINQEIQQLSAQEDLIEEKRLETSQKLAKLRAEMAVAKEQIAHLRQQLESNEERLGETEQREKVLKSQLQALTMDVSSHEVTEESLDKQVQSLREKRDEIQTELTQRQQDRRLIQVKISETDEKISQQHQLQKQLLSQKTQAEVKKSRSDVLLDNLLHYLQEEYSLTFEAAAAAYPSYSLAEKASIKQEIKQLKQEIEGLGPVNLNAIEQYQQVAERHEFLTSQRDDLVAAKDQLFDTMSEMDEEVKIRFAEVFAGIRQKFKEVFPNMFGGGRAELLLTDPTDLLNTGIEIEAQPPGKKLQNLSLLSGGERALTAIALLFSIIQVRPVPFCVLDEVEAALDEANVNRFGRYLSEFQNDTQFIVVTHRKGTMEAANVLYGVTMQESGVSRIVSVRLEEVNEGGKIQQKGVS
ncbi:chromosome segregation protein SMC [Enterococcus songbeiensis]|uniref:chromosome segregation protein SMC n=1 Tax=Enterococcus songbeiensis TaxID=2559927 RepID=UPI0010FA1942|nr:chromosome segregation protein SMC [Enterococcus songbeiensis]